MNSDKVSKEGGQPPFEKLVLGMTGSQIKTILQHRTRHRKPVSIQKFATVTSTKGQQTLHTLII